ncbi:WD repeat-containing protein 6, partial [Teratosphaeriaceae sp. CCFEE 6253]
VAGLFAQGLATATVDAGARGEAGLLVTCVGATEVTLLVMAPEGAGSGEPALVVRSTLRLGLEPRFVITAFTTLQLRGSRYAALGSRHGSVAFYMLPAPAGVESAITDPCFSLPAHGKEAVTALLWSSKSSLDPSGLLHSTGRDGMYTIHRLDLASDTGLSATLLHRLPLPFGPNLEGLALRPDNSLWIWGFRGKHFVVYDVTAQRETMALECGGANRTWAFQPSSERETRGGRFVWTQKGRLYHHHQPDTGSQLEVINAGGHGREIKALAISPQPHQTIATGAEDTNIKLWISLPDNGFRCLQTLRKHNTGIQHLQWSDDGQYLFSSGGFEECYVWRVRPAVPGVGLGVVCESAHPSSGTNDLRIMGFDARRDPHREDGEGVSFVVEMAYSDSTRKRWRYEAVRARWTLLGTGEYLTACLTHISTPSTAPHRIVTAATDGHLAAWSTSTTAGKLQWTHRHKVHQNAILSVVRHWLPGSSHLFVTGGDDNAIGLTLQPPPGDKMHTLFIPRAHAAAVTGLAIIYADDGGLVFASAGLDQRLKIWRVDVDGASATVEGIEVKCLKSMFTAVADVSSLATCTLGNRGTGVVVAGVGMEMWRVGGGVAARGVLRNEAITAD